MVRLGNVFQATAQGRDGAVSVEPDREETRALRMEVEEFNKNNEQCQKQIESLRPLVGIASISEVNEKQRAIQLECRNRSLDIRDRLLAGVRPESSVAIACGSRI